MHSFFVPPLRRHRVASELARTRARIRLGREILRATALQLHAPPSVPVWAPCPSTRFTVADVAAATATAAAADTASGPSWCRDKA
eukprot:gene8831-biopygen308